MSLDANNREELVELLEGVFAGQLTDSQTHRLEELLRDNPEARQMYVDYMALHAGIAWRFREQVAIETDSTKVDDRPVPRKRNIVTSPVLGFLRSALRVGGNTPWMRASTQIAMLLVIGVVAGAVAFAMHRLTRQFDGRQVAVAPSAPNRESLPGPASNSPIGEPEPPTSFPQNLQAESEHGSGPMLDPATDRPDGPWCYLAKSTTVIGRPEQPDVTQVTFDGALFTRNAELCFFYGEKDQPLLARQKNWLDGWIPVVQYSWCDGQIDFDIEMFAAPLDGENVDNTVNFVQLRMRNSGKRQATGRFAAALRHDGGDYRYRANAFSPKWSYEMTDRAVVRDGKLAYSFAPGADREAVPAVAYEHPFIGSQKFITPRSECCLARYRKELAPGEAFTAIFKMPRVPVSTAAFNNKVLAADYQAYRADTVAYWKNLFGGATAFTFPELRVQEAERASLVHVLLATRKVGNSWTQTDGLPYPDFFITSTPQMVLAYLQAGQFDRAKAIVLRSLTYQRPNGLYQDAALAHGVEIPAGHGHGMYSAAMTVLYSQDKAFAEKVYPNLQSAVKYIADTIAKDEYGLLPPTYPYDSEMIKGHYTSNNLWALLGLRNAIRVARFLGKGDDIAAWTELERRYTSNIVKGVDASAKPDGYVPPGLYKYLTGQAARKGFDEWQTNQDWENMLLAFPGELLPPSDPRVRGTVDHVRKNYGEGVMPYRIYMHQYITANQIEQYLTLGDDYTALKDFYHLMLHAGPTSEGFENLVRPWADRMVDPNCPSPHAWASSKMACLIRDLVLLEYGGKAGMESGDRELWLFHCLSPAWVKSGERVSISNASTEFGPVNAEMKFDANGATVNIAGKYHDVPAAYRLRVPYFKELTGVKTDAKHSRQEGDWIILSPDATTARLEWRDKPGAHLHTIERLLTDYRSANRNRGPDAKGIAIIEPGRPFLMAYEKSQKPQPLSFATVREAYQHEYGRLADEAKDLVEVEAPAMLTAADRRESYVRQFGLPQNSVMTGCKAEASSSEPGHSPEKVVDGVVTLESSWQASPYPQWLKIDLDRQVKLKAVHVWPYWGEGRYYKYFVDVSTDGNHWTTVGDRSRNTAPSTPAGEEFSFAATDVRYIRVRMLYHSLNVGVHIVEVAGIEADAADTPPYDQRMVPGAAVSTARSGDHHKK
jgi:hypothetical protein